MVEKKAFNVAPSYIFSEQILAPSRFKRTVLRITALSVKDHSSYSFWAEKISGV